MAKKVDYQIYPNVILGKNAIVESNVVIGQPASSNKTKTIIGDNAYIRANTVIYAGVKIGDNFQTGPNVLIREGNQIGSNVVIWHGTTLNPDNLIGDGSRIHAGCFLEKVELGEKVFIGPGVVFTDDPHPKIPISFRECFGGAKVDKNAVIGGGCTILPHVSLGEGCFVGAGSVVTKDIPAFKLAAGNPAKVIKKVSEIECKAGGKNHTPYKL